MGIGHLKRCEHGNAISGAAKVVRATFFLMRPADANALAMTANFATAVSKAWPYEEARKLLKRWPDGKPDGEPMVFETGYGPSGLPHIGTFNEVGARRSSAMPMRN